MVRNRLSDHPRSKRDRDGERRVVHEGNVHGSSLVARDPSTPGLCPRWRELADTEGFEPTTSASGAQSPIASSLRLLGFRDSGECAVARGSARLSTLMGLAMPPRIIQLAWDLLADAAATDREVVLARWVLLSTLREDREG